jgi:predicted transcriptional regulator
VLEAISDEISFNLFIIIGNNPKNIETLRQELNISSKQCYGRIVKLVDTGLVKRNGSHYSITSFGRLIFQTQAKIAKAIKNLSKLKLVDVILASDLARDERTKFVDEVVDDDDLREMIISRI